jgi:hypothetical protein
MVPEGESLMKQKYAVMPTGKNRYDVLFSGLTGDQALRLTAPFILPPVRTEAVEAAPAKPKARKPKVKAEEEPKQVSPERPDGAAKVFIDLLTEAGEAGITFEDLKAKFQVNDLRKLRAHIVGAKRILGNRLLKSGTGYVLKAQ